MKTDDSWRPLNSNSAQQQYIIQNYFKLQQDWSIISIIISMISMINIINPSTLNCWWYDMIYMIY